MSSRTRIDHEPQLATGDMQASGTLDLRLLAPLVLTAFVGLLNTFAFGPFLPTIADELDSSVPLLGQVAAATFFMTAFGGMFVGPLADHFGHRRAMLLVWRGLVERA